MVTFKNIQKGLQIRILCIKPRPTLISKLNTHLLMGKSILYILLSASINSLWDKEDKWIHSLENRKVALSSKQNLRHYLKAFVSTTHTPVRVDHFSTEQVSPPCWLFFFVFNLYIRKTATTGLLSSALDSHHRDSAWPAQTNICCKSEWTDNARWVTVTQSRAL